MKVLITGGTGSIGKHALLHALLRPEVTSVVALSRRELPTDISNNPKLKVLVIDGVPQQRRKLIEAHENNHVIITSYTLLQKDIDWYKATPFTYAILDEAQHIKNRGTRNARWLFRQHGTRSAFANGAGQRNPIAFVNALRLKKQRVARSHKDGVATRHPRCPASGSHL